MKYNILSLKKCRKTPPLLLKSIFCSPFQAASSVYLLFWTLFFCHRWTVLMSTVAAKVTDRVIATLAKGRLRRPGTNWNTYAQHHKSDNLQYNMLGRWVDGTNDSLTKCLMFQALFFFHIFYRIILFL